MHDYNVVLASAVYPILQPREFIFPSHSVLHKGTNDSFDVLLVPGIDIMWYLKLRSVGTTHDVRRTIPRLHPTVFCASTLCFAKGTCVRYVRRSVPYRSNEIT